MTNTVPLPLGNRNIEIYQPGSPAAIGINSGASSSSATAVTDPIGNFRIRFTPGTATFIIFSGTNPNALTLSNSPADTSFPSFSRRNFPGQGYDPGTPTYVGKLIGTSIIRVSLLTDLEATDTIGWRASTISGPISREYSGRVAPAGTVITLDTIQNLLFTDFDVLENEFINTLHAGRKWTTGWGYSTIASAGVVSPARLSAVDEPRKELLFYFRK